MCYPALQASKPRFFFPRCLLQVYKDVCDKLGPLNFFFQDVEADHHAKTGDAVTAHDMDTKGINLVEVAARFLDFETMGFLAFSVDLFHILDIYATRWQCHDLEMCDLLDGVTRMITKKWRTLTSAMKSSGGRMPVPSSANSPMSRIPTKNMFPSSRSEQKVSVVRVCLRTSCSSRLPPP